MGKLLTDLEINNLSIHQVGYIKQEDISYYDWVRAECQKNKCGYYKKNWACPPGVGSLEDCIKACKAYDRAMIFTGKYPLRREIDFKSMMKGAKLFKESCEELKTLLQDRLDSFLIFTAGACHICPQCSYPDPCKFPNRLIPSLESMGINVSELVRKAGVSYAEEALSIIYIGLVLY